MIIYQIRLWWLENFSKPCMRFFPIESTTHKLSALWSHLMWQFSEGNIRQEWSQFSFPTMELTIIHISQCLMPFSPMSPWLTEWHSTMLLTPFSIMTPFYGCILPVWPLCQACNCLSQFKEISFSSARLMPLHGFKHLLHRSYNQPNLYLAPGEIAVHGIKQCSFSSWHHVLELRGTGSLP